MITDDEDRERRKVFAGQQPEEPDLEQRLSPPGALPILLEFALVPARGHDATARISAHYGAITTDESSKLERSGGYNRRQLMQIVRIAKAHADEFELQRLMHERSRMPIKLNHTIVYSSDKQKGAEFLTDLFGLPPASAWGPFATVELANQVTLDYLDADGDVAPQHYCFLVGEPEFDAIFGRIQKRGLPHWADPGHRITGEINTHDGGRGVYFDDPSGHILEIITQPYGNER